MLKEMDRLIWWNVMDEQLKYLANIKNNDKWWEKLNVMDK